MKPGMNTKRLVSVVLNSLVIVLVAATGAALPAPSTNNTIRIGKLGVAFDLPRGFAALQDDLTHGSWRTIISVGKEFRPNHLVSAPLQIAFWPAGFDGKKSLAEYTPRQYVDVELKRIKEALRQHLPGFQWEPEIVQLFGNKGIRITFMGLDKYVVVLGYLRPDQVPKTLSQEYLVRIAITMDTSDYEFERLYGNLIDTVVSSLRTIR